MNQKNKLNKILVVHKSTAFEEFKKRRRNLNLSEKQFRQDFPQFMKAHQQHEDSLKAVLDILHHFNLSVKVVARDQFDSGDSFDLVISVGGDGTFLRTSHGVKSAMMMGVNSAPGHSVGALCSASGRDFKSRMAAIISGQYKIRELNRLELIVNGQTIPVLGLNDVLLANRSPAGTSRYRLSIGNNSEEQKSSGVWIATASGSTAAILAARGKRMPPLSKKIQYLVREPYQGGETHIRLKKGFVMPSESVDFLIEMHDASLFVDGPDGEFALRFGDEVTITNSNKPLRVLY